MIQSLTLWLRSTTASNVDQTHLYPGKTAQIICTYWPNTSTVANPFSFPLPYKTVCHFRSHFVNLRISLEKQRLLPYITPIGTYRLQLIFEYISNSAEIPLIYPSFARLVRSISFAPILLERKRPHVDCRRRKHEEVCGGIFGTAPLCARQRMHPLCLCASRGTCRGSHGDHRAFLHGACLID